MDNEEITKKIAQKSYKTTNSIMDKFLLNLGKSSETPGMKKWIELLLYKEELVDVVNDSYKSCLEYCNYYKITVNEFPSQESRLRETLELEKDTQTGLQIDWTKRRELEEAVEYVEHAENQSRIRARELLRQLETLMTVDGEIVDGTDESKFSRQYTIRRKILGNIHGISVYNLLYLLIELENIKTIYFESTFIYNKFY